MKKARISGSFTVEKLTMINRLTVTIDCDMKEEESPSEWGLKKFGEAVLCLEQEVNADMRFRLHVGDPVVDQVTLLDE